MHIFDYANVSLPIVIFTKQLLSFLQVVQNLFTENFCDISSASDLSHLNIMNFSPCVLSKSEKSEKSVPSELFIALNASHATLRSANSFMGILLSFSFVHLTW